MAELHCERADQNPIQPVKKKEKAKAIKKRGEEPMRQVLHGMAGVDPTTIDTIGVGTAEVVISEYGTDLSAGSRAREKFVKHLRLAPLGNPLPGASHSAKAKAKRALPGRARRCERPPRRRITATAPSARTIAGLPPTKDPMWRSLLSTARKLACLIYRMLCRGQAYVDEGVAAYEKRYQAARISRLKATANQLGFKLEPQTSAA